MINRRSVLMMMVMMLVSARSFKRRMSAVGRERMWHDAYGWVLVTPAVEIVWDQCPVPKVDVGVVIHLQCQDEPRPWARYLGPLDPSKSPWALLRRSSDMSW
ncbi:unnamed protein product [Microthlaspi erraticum]|uniref:Secreted protein n=1 Tax=Microthlaspi erraticum TaxID=1685480 RepID=A0A6D2KS41_9BRAS|nr:unnamed protein product [Microthlaspi erraticum]